ncbi:hypothetical protein C0989_000685 [Termitomyces sp. Mn162]|nr:hypothetical protein C0989_000685 [Termitomyces sp. Mn162]
MTGSAPDDNFAPSILSSTETFWRDHYDFLKAHGYTLRDRYHPDWVPSWEKNPSKKWLHCEDGLYIEHGQVLDATRDDGSLVVLKEIKTNTNKYEIPVSKFFSFGALATHPKNHCVPVIEVIDPPEGSQSAFIVMPYLLNTHHPPFQTIGEVVDFFRQIFEGGDDLVKPKQGLGFMRELVDDMINSDPKKRPSMSEVVARFETIVKGLDDKTLRSPVVEVD